MTEIRTFFGSVGPVSVQSMLSCACERNFVSHSLSRRWCNPVKRCKPRNNFKIAGDASHLHGVYKGTFGLQRLPHATRNNKPFAFLFHKCSRPFAPVYGDWFKGRDFSLCFVDEDNIMRGGEIFTAHIETEFKPLND